MFYHFAFSVDSGDSENLLGLFDFEKTANLTQIIRNFGDKELVASYEARNRYLDELKSKITNGLVYSETAKGMKKNVFLADNTQIDADALGKLRKTWPDSEMTDFTSQPLEGLLYDLDLLPEQINDPVELLRARTIEYLYGRKELSVN